MPKKSVTLEHLDEKLAQWRTRLKRAINKVDALEKERKRLLRREAAPRIPAAAVVVTDAPVRYPTLPPSPGPLAAPADLPATLEPASPETIQDVQAAWGEQPLPEVIREAIPAFLQRSKIAQVDALVALKLKAEQAETKKAKARGRIEKMKATKRGDTRRMPLTGKAALDHIRNG